MPVLRRDRHWKIHNPSERCRLRFQGPRRAAPVKEDFLCLPQCVRKAYSSSPQRETSELQQNYVCCNTGLKETFFLPSGFCIEFSGVSIYFIFIDLCLCVSWQEESIRRAFPTPRRDNIAAADFIRTVQ